MRGALTRTTPTTLEETEMGNMPTSPNVAGVILEQKRIPIGRHRGKGAAALAGENIAVKPA